jgi:hypothetical protein
VLVNYAQTLRLTWSGTEFKILTDLQIYGSLVTRRLGNVRTKESPAVSSRLRGLAATGSDDRVCALISIDKNDA